jgi:hypothetical protein
MRTYLEPIVIIAVIFTGLFYFLSVEKKVIIEITFPAEDIRCVQQDGKIVFCESYKVWRKE